jgi:hypothetical protein
MGDFTVPKVVKFVKREPESLAWLSIASPVALDRLETTAMMGALLTRYLRVQGIM